MRNLATKSVFFIFSFLAACIVAMTTGCASGGFKLTRSYAGWVNSQNIILRIVIYVLGFFIFFITILIDMVLNNTIDFWEGRVAAGDYQFQEGTKTYNAHHEYLPGTKLRRSVIHVSDSAGAASQEIILSETPSSEIELYVDGKLRLRVSDIASVPMAAIFDANEKLVQKQSLNFLSMGADLLALNRK